MPERTFVIVGAGLAGARAAEALRDKGFDGRVLLLGDEDHLPYDRPPLSKGYLQGKDDSPLLHDHAWYAERDIEVRTRTTVDAIDIEAHTVTTVAGEQIGYDKLLLATGSHAVVPDLAGVDLLGVHTLRRVEDSDALRAAFDPAAKVVVVGGGWIGLEVAAAARIAGAEVTVLEGREQPLLAAMGPSIGAVFADLHREHGVDLRTEVKVMSLEEAEGAGAGSGRVGSVVLADGSRLPATVVVLGVGAAPNLTLADEGGLAVNGGVAVDASGRSSDPDVYAAGDIADLDNPQFGGRVRVEHWANAHDQPLTVAAAMLGEDVAFDLLPFFYTDQYDLGMEFVGLNHPDDEVVVRGETTGSREFIAFWLDDDCKVTAAMACNIWDQVEDLKAIILGGKEQDPTRLRDARVPLSDLA